MQSSLQRKDKICLFSVKLENVPTKCPQAAPQSTQGRFLLPKASLNTEILHSLSKVSLHFSHCPKCFQRTEKQMKYANLSQTEKNQTKEEPAIVVIEEL